MLYFVCENAQYMEQQILLPLNEFTEENLNEKTMCKNDIGFKTFKNLNVSIKLHSFVCAFINLAAMLWTSLEL